MRTVSKIKILTFLVLFVCSFIAISFGSAQSTVSADSKSERREAACKFYKDGTSNPNAGGGASNSSPSKEKYDACVQGFNKALEAGSIATDPGVNPCTFYNLYTTNLTLQQACNYGYGQAYSKKDEINKLGQGSNNNNNSGGSESSAADEACDSIAPVSGSSNGLGLFNACKEGYEAAENDPSDSSKNSACDSYTGVSKQKCQEGFDKAVQNANEDTSSDEVDCDASGAILSWIICPVIDLGTNMTDYVFNSLLKPMLANVPVSSNPDSSTYKAWTSFRIIANVLLVGTLLAVVYSQVRGPK